MIQVPVRDAKIYVDTLGQIVIGYETKGTNMKLSIDKEEIKINDVVLDSICVRLVTDSWFITEPRSPRALKKRRADIYIGLENVKDLIEALNQIGKNLPRLKRSDCPGFRESFFPTGLEDGPKNLPEGFNCFRAPLLDATLDIKDLNTILKPISGEFFIDFEKSDVTHLYKFNTPALHFALRAPTWSRMHYQLKYNEWKIHIDIRCEKAMLDCISRIAESGI